ncbi:hypothetical protein [Pedobacter sp. FW305-3-2-15-E-R2A2]|uniref:hypothetical protein n=1 Tax=Pedobacter sp. FW305-3-2-15-E-R2A2 TaxID=3140251 RepID=UPI00313FF8B2
MSKTLIFISVVILFLCTSCSRGNKKDSLELSSKYPEVVVPYKLNNNEIKLLKKRDIGFNELKNWIASRFSKDLDSVNSDEIDTVYARGSLALKNYGNSRMFIGQFSASLPETLYKTFYIVFNEDRGEASLFFMDNYNIVRLRADEEQGYLSGLFKIKSKGYYQIYAFNNDTFKLVLNTNSDIFCENGIPVENNSTDCVSYNPFTLNFENKDVNNDGLLDLRFTGDALIYCEGLETGRGREDGKERKKIKLDLKFIVDSTGSLPAWKLVDSTFCNILRKY